MQRAGMMSERLLDSEGKEGAPSPSQLSVSSPPSAMAAPDTGGDVAVEGIRTDEAKTVELETGREGRDRRYCVLACDSRRSQFVNFLLIGAARPASRLHFLSWSFPTAAVAGIVFSIVTVPFVSGGLTYLDRFWCFMSFLPCVFMVVSNSAFGSRLVRTRNLDTFLEWGIRHTDMNAEALLQPLRREEQVMIIIIPLLSALWPGLNIYVSLTAHPSWFLFIFGAAGNAYCYLQNFHLCGIWLWQNWVMSRALDGYLRRKCFNICRDEHDRQACLPDGKLLVTLLKTCTTTSEEWKRNHQWRCIGTVIVGTVHMALFLSLLHRVRMDYAISVIIFVGWLMAIALISFVIVVLTSFVPGYIMDDFFDEVQKKIVDAVELGAFDNKKDKKKIRTFPEDPEDLAAEKSSTFKNNRLEATALLQRLSVLRGVRGISFAGFQMTTSNALTVASIVAFCMFNLTFTLYPVKYN